MTTTRTTYDIAFDLYQTGARGGTVPVVAGVRVPKAGYVVALPEYGLRLRDATLADILTWVTTVLPRAARPSHHVAVGSWTDDGYTYLDVVEVVPELPDALHRAESRGELAIYDLAAKIEIPVRPSVEVFV